MTEPIARAIVIYDDGREPEDIIGVRNFREIQKLLGCDCLDHSTQYVKGHKFNVLVDDSGLITGRKPMTDTVDSLIGLEPHKNILYGTLWVEPWGDDRHKLTDEEVEVLLSRMVWKQNRFTGERHTVLIVDSTHDWTDIDGSGYDVQVEGF